MRTGVGALIGLGWLWSCKDDLSISGVPPGSAGRFGASIPEANDTVLVAPAGAGASAPSGPAADAAAPTSFGPVQ
ncbi:MAG TPA: hypothetical protein VMG12_22085, partial [Polyangiaceae bacterium]|nr:hypothetical protein [Polyangiaceae bacterium]